MITESGEINTIVHIWVYEDAADRAKRRAAMAADPDWQAYLKKSGEAGISGKPAHQADDAGEIRHPLGQALTTEIVRCAPMTDRGPAAKSSSIN